MEREGIPTHFVERLNDREMLVKRLQIIPVETVVRNIVAGSLAKRLGMEEGKTLPQPIVEYYYKDDALEDPMINQWHITVFEMATKAELRTVTEMALKINGVLRPFFGARHRCSSTSSSSSAATTGRSCSATRSVPDTCRFWDVDDPQEARQGPLPRDLGGVEEAYHEIAPARRAPRPEARPMRARVYVTPKKGVLDPQGKAVEHSLHALGLPEVARRPPRQVHRAVARRRLDVSRRGARRRDVPPAAGERRHRGLPLRDRRVTD